MTTQESEPGQGQGQDQDAQETGIITRSKRKRLPKIINPEEESYTPEEIIYYKSLSDTKKRHVANLEARMLELNDNTTPIRFKILFSNIDEKLKAIAIQKLNHLYGMNESDGEYHKTLHWIESMCKIPFNKFKPLPVWYGSSKTDIQSFIQNTKKKFDEKIYGHKDAKDYIVRLLAQWISNPNSKGMTIGIQGSMGCGKTMLVKEGICGVLDLPFAFIPLGGANDGCYLDGHSYTYEGATWGKIVDVLMKSGYMNLVFFFDELDKVSDTYKGEEIISKLIHLTDFTQNDKIHDKYFYEFEFDLSRCIFVFSYNNEASINPILRDRMIKIKTNTYTVKDKVNIAQGYMIESLLKEFNMNKEDVVFSNEIIENIIRYIDEEDGVRNLKRAINDILSNLNLIRMVSDEGLELPYIVKDADISKYIYHRKDAKNDKLPMMYI